MSRLRIMYIASLCILGIILASIVYLIPGKTTKYKEITRAEMIKLDKGWVIQMDLNNPDEQDRDYNISVKAGSEQPENEDAVIKPDSKFRYSCGTDPEQQQSVTLKVYRKGDEALPWVQEIHHYE